MFQRYRMMAAASAAALLALAAPAAAQTTACDDFLNGDLFPGYAIGVACDSELSSGLGDARDAANDGAATSIAMAGIDLDPGASGFQLGIGAGAYAGRFGFAGRAGYAFDDRVFGAAGLGFSQQGEVAGAVSMTVRLGGD